MGSAGIEYGVDMAMLLCEEKEYTKNGSGEVGPQVLERIATDGERSLILKLVKNRFGRRAEIRMTFCPDISEFTESMVIE